MTDEKAANQTAASSQSAPTIGRISLKRDSGIRVVNVREQLDKRMRILSQVEFQLAVKQQVQGIAVGRDGIVIDAAVDVFVGICEIEEK